MVLSVYHSLTNRDNKKNIYKHLPIKTKIQINVINNRKMHAQTGKKVFVALFLVFVRLPIYLVLEITVTKRLIVNKIYLTGRSQLRRD